MNTSNKRSSDPEKWFQDMLLFRVIGVGVFLIIVTLLRWLFGG